MKPNEIQAGDTLTVRVRSVKVRPEARWITVEILGLAETSVGPLEIMPLLESDQRPVANFRFSRMGDEDTD